MRSRVREKREAIRLRSLGYTYREIREVVKVSKSTLSGWITRVKFTEEESQLLSSRVLVGREKASQKAATTNIKRRIERDREIEKTAEASFEKFIKEPLFAFGISMYWAEGSKKNYRNFRFINSDPRLIKLMLEWMRRYLDSKGQERLRLYIHQPYAHEKCETFWSLVTSIPVAEFKKTVYKQTPHDVKKNPSYKGCLSIDLTKVHFYVTVMKWIELLDRYLLRTRP